MYIFSIRVIVNTTNYKVNACIKSGLKGATDVKPLLSSSDAEDITFPECV